MSGHEGKEDLGGRERALTSGGVVVVELSKAVHQRERDASVRDDHQGQRHDQQRQVEKYRVHLPTNRAPCPSRTATTKVGGTRKTWERKLRENDLSRSQQVSAVGN